MKTALLVLYVYYFLDTAFPCPIFATLRFAGVVSEKKVKLSFLSSPTRFVTGHGTPLPTRLKSLPVGRHLKRKSYTLSLLGSYNWTLFALRNGL